tara:strand:- start:303 stop:743 length:441 start_codon:yes stop_codon:yes gene_type:complete
MNYNYLYSVTKVTQKQFLERNNKMKQIDIDMTMEYSYLVWGNPAEVVAQGQITKFTHSDFNVYYNSIKKEVALVDQTTTLIIKVTDEGNYLGIVQEAMSGYNDDVWSVFKNYKIRNGQSWGADLISDKLVGIETLNKQLLRKEQYG